MSFIIDGILFKKKNIFLNIQNELGIKRDPFQRKINFILHVLPCQSIRVFTEVKRKSFSPYRFGMVGLRSRTPCRLQQYSSIANTLFESNKLIVYKKFFKYHIWSNTRKVMIDYFKLTLLILNIVNKIEITLKLWTQEQVPV